MIVPFLWIRHQRGCLICFCLFFADFVLCHPICVNCAEMIVGKFYKGDKVKIKDNGQWRGSKLTGFVCDISTQDEMQYVSVRMDGGSTTNVDKDDMRVRYWLILQRSQSMKFQ